MQRVLVRQFLSTAGYSITSCAELAVAFESLTNNSFGVALVDLELDGGSGMELVREIARRELKTKVVIHHAKESIRSVKEGIGFKVFAYLDKSEGLDQLKMIIERANAEYLKDSLSFANQEVQLQFRLLDSLQEGVIATNSNLNVIYANQAACLLLSIPKGELLSEIASNWFHFVRGGVSNHPNWLETELQNFDWTRPWFEEAYSVDRIRSSSMHDIGPDGETQRIFRISVSPIPGPSGEISGYILLFTDITQEKKAEKQLQDAIQIANRAQRVAMLGQIATVIGHELNQPLSAINNYVGGLLLGCVADSQKVDLPRVLKLVQDQSLRASKIIRHLRSYVNPTGFHHELLRINETIEHAIQLVAVEVRSCRVEIELILELESPVVHGNELLLSQVFVNILRNAIEAIELAGAANRTVIVKSWRLDSYVYIEINDYGPGVSQEKLDSLFVAYKSTNTGLGLAISHSILGQHHGSIVAKNRVPSGMSFLIKLPCEEKQ